MVRDKIDGLFVEIGGATHRRQRKNGRSDKFDVQNSHFRTKTLTYGAPIAVKVVMYLHLHQVNVHNKLERFIQLIGCAAPWEEVKLEEFRSSSVGNRFSWIETSPIHAPNLVKLVACLHPI